MHGVCRRSAGKDFAKADCVGMTQTASKSKASPGGQGRVDGWEVARVADKVSRDLLWPARATSCRRSKPRVLRYLTGEAGPIGVVATLGHRRRQPLVDQGDQRHRH